MSWTEGGSEEKSGRERCRVGMMSLATSCDITRHHAIGSGSGSGAGGVRRHSSEGVAEEGRGGGSGSGRQAGVGSGSGRRVGVGSVRGSPYNHPPSRQASTRCGGEWDRTERN